MKDSMTTFSLPPAVALLVTARNELRRHYQRVGLKFTIDGNLLGDLGEAVAAELFNVTLTPARSSEGIDGFTPDNQSVQVKATGTNRGPAFRLVETKADYLLFFEFDLDRALGLVVFNGPESIATRLLPKTFQGQRSLTRRQIRDANAQVQINQRLPMALGEDPISSH
jgi:hypothetical protein